jgi:hypothetical protein
MPSLNYSSGALSTLPSFHRKTFVVFVEGDDDKPFWNVVFQSFGFSDYILKPAGGDEEIEKYSRSIISDDADIVVARDADFTEILGMKHDHTRIIYTYGHSIENTLYHPESIAEYVAIGARTPNEYSAQTTAWLEGFALEFKALLCLEIGNEKYKRGIEVLGAKCYKFLQSPKAHTPSIDRVRQHVKKINGSFSADEINEAEILLALHSARKPWYFIIRGHFLTHAVKNYIQNEVRRITSKDYPISEEALYAQLIAGLRNQCLLNPARVDLDYLKSQIARLS